VTVGSCLTQALAEWVFAPLCVEFVFRSAVIDAPLQDARFLRRLSVSTGALHSALTETPLQRACAAARQIVFRSAVIDTPLQWMIFGGDFFDGALGLDA